MQKVSSRIKFLLKNKTLLSNLYRVFLLRKTGNKVVDENNLASSILGYEFHCENPKTFNEYLVWIKLNYHCDLWKRCADKIEVKEYLKERGFGSFVPKTFQILNSINEIDMDALPECSVIKTNNDSGSVFILEKSNTKRNKEIFKRIEKALQGKYSDGSFEWVYEDIKPRIIVEEKLTPLSGNDLADYKFFTFNGKVKFGFSAHNRKKDVRFYVFDRDYNKFDCEYIYNSPKINPTKPDNWDQLVSLAEEIASDFEFARIDLYNTNKGPMIGEITFFSQSGMGPFIPKKFDLDFGKFFEDTIFYKKAKQIKEYILK